MLSAQIRGYPTLKVYHGGEAKEQYRGEWQGRQWRHPHGQPGTGALGQQRQRSRSRGFVLNSSSRGAAGCLPARELAHHCTLLGVTVLSHPGTRPAASWVEGWLLPLPAALLCSEVGCFNPFAASAAFHVCWARPAYPHAAPAALRCRLSRAVRAQGLHPEAEDHPAG